MDLRRDLVPILADGRFHSGARLGQRLGVSRATVHKCIDELAAAGLDVHRVRGRGYRVPGGIETLSAERIGRWLQRGGHRGPDSLEVVDDIASTNACLLGRPAPQPGACAVLLAERQSAGRGRRGRSWVATPYRNILLSMAWRLDGGPAATSGLSLAAGVAVAGALEAAGLAGTGLKWPNDVLWGGRKLAGVLVDVAGEAQGPTQVVLGVGVNLRLGHGDGGRIDQPWVDLHSIMHQPPARNQLAALLIASLRDMFERFAADGYAAFRDGWELRNVHAGLPVTACAAAGPARSGRVLGTDERGALLLLDAEGRTHALSSGEISLRGAS